MGAKFIFTSCIHKHVNQTWKYIPFACKPIFAQPIGRKKNSPFTRIKSSRRKFSEQENQKSHITEDKIMLVGSLQLAFKFGQKIYHLRYKISMRALLYTRKNSTKIQISFIQSHFCFHHRSFIVFFFFIDWWVFISFISVFVKILKREEMKKMRVEMVTPSLISRHVTMTFSVILNSFFPPFTFVQLGAC